MKHTNEDFASFVEAELPRLLRLAHRLTHNEHDAWDLVQDTMVRVGTRWARIDHNGDPQAYARTVMVRLHWRRSRRQGREIPCEPDSLRNGVVVDHAACVADADLATRLLTSLAPRQRSVMVLRYCYDLPLAEIAALLGCSLGTVKSQHARALANLRQSDPAVRPTQPPSDVLSIGEHR